MQKLSSLTDKEKMGDQPLDGVYRLTIDLKVNDTALKTLQEKISSLGEVETLSIEKYRTTYDLNIGDVVEIVSSLNLEKPVYVDANDNLTISDKIMSEAVSSVGTFSINIPAGMIAEVNKKATDDSVELLFTGSSVNVAKLEKEAFIGILNIPCTAIVKYKYNA